MGWADVDGVGELFAAVVLIASSFGPTLALSALPASLTQTFASARRLFALMDEVPAVEETGTSTPAYSGMALDHVSFAYPDQMAGHGSNPNAGLDQDANGTTRHAAADHAAGVFTDLSLEIPVHGILGVQGPSGRGKSTMLKLLMRYWDPQSGIVTMSGEDLRTVDAHHRRRVQTMLAQETYLFDGTIRENLLMALGDRTADDGGDAMLRGALAKASALQLVDSLPDGLDTQVGELGGRLSEGERQRIGLARVFLRHADLVLLDEPTSRLDAFNEAVILQSINELASEPRGGDGVGGIGSGDFGNDKGGPIAPGKALPLYWSLTVIPRCAWPTPSFGSRTTNRDVLPAADTATNIASDIIVSSIISEAIINCMSKHCSSNHADRPSRPTS